MPLLSALSDDFLADERVAGSILLDSPGVLAQAIAATRMYAGYAGLIAHDGVVPAPDITGSTDISIAEWAVIRPLLSLYAERETAMQLEATRGMGLDVFGRSMSEIQADITQAHLDLPHLAFCQLIRTV